jgi:cytoskeletal protein CcmA (bactofilin family)
MGTGDASGTWGTTTNTNLELIGEAFGFGTEGITTNADTHSTVVADGASDAGRAMYLQYTGTLDSACTITITPNTMKRMQFIENGTSGSQNIIIKQGSGATITIPPGDVKAVYLDGAGSGAAVVDAFASLNVVDLKIQDDLTLTDDLIVNGDIDLEGSIDVNGTSNLDVVDIDGAVNMATTALVTGVLTTTAATVFNGGFASNADSTMGTDKKIQFRDAAIYINSSADGQLDVVADTEIQIAATTIDINGAINASGEIIAASLDISGDIDVDGTTNLDVVDIDGAVDMATTLAVAGVATAATSANITEGALTDGTVAWDAAAKANATLLLEENSTISAPSNAVAGAIISIEVAQHATSGPYTLAWNTVFEFASSTAPTMTATDAKTDIFSFRYNGSVWQEIGRVQNLAQT